MRMQHPQPPSITMDHVFVTKPSSPRLVLPILVAIAPVTYPMVRQCGALSSRRTSLCQPAAPFSASVCAVTILWGFTRDASRSAATIAVALLPVLTFGYQLDALPTVVPSIVRWPLLIANVGVAASLIGLTWRRDIRLV